MRRFKTMLTVIGAVTVLVLAGNTVAFAATGGKFYLGKVNKANKQSVLKRTTSGPALKLATASSGNAPLVTNGRGKVANLNADLLDGKDSTALQTTAHVYSVVVSAPTTEMDVVIPVPAGRYLISYSAYLTTSSGSLVSCVVMRRSTAAPATDTWVGRSQFTAPAGSYTGLTGTAYVEKSGDATIHLGCDGPAFTTTPLEPIQVVATRLSAVSGPVGLVPQP